MNTKGNQRYVYTKNKIKGVFLKLLGDSEPEKITVSEICAKANIHRTTFYGHYEDINALMKELIGAMYEQIMGFFITEGEEGVKSDGFLRLFEMVQSQRAFFLYYFSHMKQITIVDQVLPELLVQQMNRVLEVMRYESEEELFYHQTFFCSGLIAVMNRWLRGGCKESPEEMCSIIHREYFLKYNIFKAESNHQEI